MVDKRYPLNETGQAMRDLKGGQARGKIIITVSDDQETERERILRQLDELRNK